MPALLIRRSAWLASLLLAACTLNYRQGVSDDTPAAASALIVFVNVEVYAIDGQRFNAPWEPFPLLWDRVQLAPGRHTFEFEFREDGGGRSATRPVKLEAELKAGRRYQLRGKVSKGSSEYWIADVASRMVIARIDNRPASP